MKLFYRRLSYGKSSMSQESIIQEGIPQGKLYCSRLGYTHFAWNPCRVTVSVLETGHSSLKTSSTEPRASSNDDGSTTRRSLSALLTSHNSFKPLVTVPSCTLGNRHLV